MGRLFPARQLRPHSYFPLPSPKGLVVALPPTGGGWGGAVLVGGH